MYVLKFRCAMDPLKAPSSRDTSRDQAQFGVPVKWTSPSLPTSESHSNLLLTFVNRFLTYDDSWCWSAWKSSMLSFFAFQVVITPSEDSWGPRHWPKRTSESWFDVNIWFCSRMHQNLLVQMNFKNLFNFFGLNNYLMNFSLCFWKNFNLAKKILMNIYHETIL